MKLSPHFTLEEMIASETAARMGLDNMPSDAVKEALAWTADEMEEVRIKLGGLPIHVNSGYRCLELNIAVGGAANSDHIHGWAVDFICPAFGSPLGICSRLSSLIEFSTMIYEYSWVHLAFVPEFMGRNTIMTKNTKVGYVKGLIA